jgi:hypothetical protein
MSQNINQREGCCCGPSVQNVRMLTFPDGSKVGIIRLDTVMEDLFQQGKPADSSTALEMINRLKRDNYISPSAQDLYLEVLLSDYQHFCEIKLLSIKKENNKMANQDSNQNEKKKGLFGNVFKADKKEKSKNQGCCNIKIVPKEQTAEGKKTENGDSDCDCGCCK